MFEAKLIADYACETGENPLWHPKEKRLYWTDIEGGRLFRYDPREQRHEQIYAGRPVGGFTFMAEGGLLLFLDRGMIASWRDGMLTTLIDEIPAERESRFNDVIADPAGRVFCGTMASPHAKGRLYRLDLDGTLNTVLEGVGCSNGMAFTLDRNGFYYTDSFAGEIYLFDYDERDGSIGNRRVFARLPAAAGLPDGMTVDTEGRVWSALWDGGCIVRFDADGKIDERYAMPALKTTSLTFGGEGLRDLYITSAGGHDKAGEGPLAGGLFCMNMQVAGLPEFFSRISPERIALAG
jgi:D-xylonolactonase